MIGCDIVHIPSFAQQLEIPGTTILQWFSATEQQQSQVAAGLAQAAPHLAARWAAKEAFLKAWSARNYGHAPQLDASAIVWREIEVVADAWGRPRLAIHGSIQAASGVRTAAVSMSHDGDYATAVCQL